MGIILKEVVSLSKPELYLYNLRNINDKVDYAKTFKKLDDSWYYRMSVFNEKTQCFDIYFEKEINIDIRKRNKIVNRAKRGMISYGK